LFPTVAVYILSVTCNYIFVILTQAWRLCWPSLVGSCWYRVGGVGLDIQTTLGI